MRILIDIGHPAYVLFFRAVIPTLQQHGHEVFVTSREKDITTVLLDECEIPHVCLSTAGRSRLGLFCEMLIHDWRLWRVIRQFKPDLVLSRDGVFACQSAWLAGVPSISFDDTDDAKLQQTAYFPFATRIYTDHTYRTPIGKKQRFYNGVSPLAYLHPRVFQPDPSVLSQAGIDTSRPLIVIRLVSWTASHDYGQHGFDLNLFPELVASLEKRGRVLITSEVPLSAELEPYRVNMPAKDIHHLMAYASLYIGESATMAAESAVLGTPAIYFSTRSTWYTKRLEEPYGLVRHVSEARDCITEANAILDTPNVEEVFRERRDAYLRDADDLHEVVLEAISEFTPADAELTTNSSVN